MGVPVEKPMVFMQFRVEPDLLEEIERLAAKLKLNRSQLMRNLVNSGLEDLRLAERVGLVSLISFMRSNNIQAENIMEMVIENSRA